MSDLAMSSIALDVVVLDVLLALYVHCGNALCVICIDVYGF